MPLACPFQHGFASKCIDFNRGGFNGFSFRFFHRVGTFDSGLTDKIKSNSINGVVNLGFIDGLFDGFKILIVQFIDDGIGNAQDILAY